MKTEIIIQAKAIVNKFHNCLSQIAIKKVYLGSRKNLKRSIIILDRFVDNS